MKTFGLIALGLLIAGCVQADSQERFKSEEVSHPNFTVYRFIDTETNIVCYTHSKSIACIKL
jgi:hypothetical protein